MQRPHFKSQNTEECSELACNNQAETVTAFCLTNLKIVFAVPP